MIKKKLFIPAIIMACILGVFAWSRLMYHALVSPVQEQQTTRSPSVAATAAFYDVPWGLSHDQVERLCKARNLAPAPKGFYATSALNYRINWGGYPANVSFAFRENHQSDYSVFYQGALRLDKEDCPIENFYGQMDQELTKLYGDTPDRGYPPLRNTLDEKPWGSGSGKIWQVTLPDGQHIEIESQLNLADKGFLKLIYRNISVERKYKNLLNPLPEGDPASAATDLKGFRNICWGITPLQVKQEIGAAGFTFSKETGSPLNHTLTLSFSNGTFAGQPIGSIDFFFKYDRFYFCSLNFARREKEVRDELYGQLRSYLELEYGTPLVHEDFKGRQQLIWEFPLAGFEPNRIMLHQDRDSIMIGYMNPALEMELNNL